MAQGNLFFPHCQPVLRQKDAEDPLNLTMGLLLQVYVCLLYTSLFHSPFKKFPIQCRVIAVCLKEGFQSNGKMVCFLDGAGFVFFSGTLKNEREQFIRIHFPLIHCLIDFIG